MFLLIFTPYSFSNLGYFNGAGRGSYHLHLLKLTSVDMFGLPRTGHIVNCRLSTLSERTLKPIPNCKVLPVKYRLSSHWNFSSRIGRTTVSALCWGMSFSVISFLTPRSLSFHNLNNRDQRCTQRRIQKYKVSYDSAYLHQSNDSGFCRPNILKTSGTKTIAFREGIGGHKDKLGVYW